ncbi:MAG: hypothetical protein WDO24_27450 [Pseudomonadota bacterium]
MPSRAPPAPDERIAIGYLSSDFREHPTAYLITALLEQHDRRHFRIGGYSIGPAREGPSRQRVIAACDSFCDLAALSDAEAAARIAADRVEILVDLNGHCGGGRPVILSHRPAPIQVNWLGYPGTLGTPFMDYAVVDPVIAPPTEPASFDEQLVRLPNCYQPNDRIRPVTAQPPARHTLGLPEDGFVLCCFNATYKIRSECFAIWMDLLARAPDSVLWLLRHDDSRDCQSARQRGGARHRSGAPGVRAQRRLGRTLGAAAPGRPVPRHLALRRPYLGQRRAPVGGSPADLSRPDVSESGRRQQLLSALALPELIATLAGLNMRRWRRGLLQDRDPAAAASCAARCEPGRRRAVRSAAVYPRPRAGLCPYGCAASRGRAAGRDRRSGSWPDLRRRPNSGTDGSATRRGKLLTVSRWCAIIVT